jgi:hypothetical protein
MVVTFVTSSVFGRLQSKKSQVSFGHLEKAEHVCSFICCILLLFLLLPFLLLFLLFLLLFFFLLLFLFFLFFLLLLLLQPCILGPLACSTSELNFENKFKNFYKIVY